MNKADTAIKNLVKTGKYQPLNTDLTGTSPALKRFAEAEENKLATEIEQLYKEIQPYLLQIRSLEILKEGYSELQCDIANKEGYGGKAA